jgi:hypothetical protein
MFGRQTEANCLQHDEFLNDPDGRHYDWRLTNWSSAVRTALGGKALLLFRGAFVVLLAPAVVLATYSLYANSFALMILVLLSFWGFWVSSPSPTGIGMLASMFVAIVAFVLGCILQDKLVAFSCMLPGVTWFGSCAILGTTTSYLSEALRKSEASFHMLISRGIIVATPISELTIAPKRRSGAQKNQGFTKPQGESSRSDKKE